jgi:hypothetical protein
MEKGLRSLERDFQEEDLQFRRSLLEMFLRQGVSGGEPCLFSSHQAPRCYCFSKTTSSVKGLPSLSVPDM